MINKKILSVILLVMFFSFKVVYAIEGNFLNSELIVENNYLFYFDNEELILADASILKITKNSKIDLTLFSLNTEDSNIYLLCRYPNTEKQLKLILPLFRDNVELIKLYVKDNFVYILTGNKNSEKDERNLFRVDLDSTKIFKKKGVCDVLIEDNLGVLLLEKMEDLFFFNNNGVKVPLKIAGTNISLKQSVDNRIIFISSNQGVELVDMKNNKSIYFYSESESGSTELVKPIIKENVIISCVDLGTARLNMGYEYYKIIINGKEVGRTETALPPVQKSFVLTLKAGEYNLIQLERMVLDKDEGVYKRANNVYQPKPLQVLIPRGHYFFLNYKYTGTKYQVEKKLSSTNN